MAKMLEHLGVAVNVKRSESGVIAYSAYATQKVTNWRMLKIVTVVLLLCL